MTPDQLLPLPKGTVVYLLEQEDPVAYLYDGPSSYRYQKDTDEDGPRLFHFVCQRNGYARTLRAVELGSVHATRKHALEVLLDLAVAEQARLEMLIAAEDTQETN